MTHQCTSWLGHKFEPRYSEEGQKLDPTWGALMGSMWTTTTVQSGGRVTEHPAPQRPTYKRTYHGDVCARCGARSAP